MDQVVNLALGRLYDYLRIDESSGPDDLFDDILADYPKLITPWGGRQKDCLRDPLDKLAPLERSVIQGAGQTEAVFDEGALSRCIPFEHRANLRNSYVRLVDDQKKILWEVVDKAIRW
ncbi:hypothetical protein GALL_522680 [mine drainage metagenome]|uniref:Uncharacterized protein n=1 Tax=mine drainage metagenome TaxID=410659 RepID=A0A1J5PED6_9ZZZZ